MTNLNILETSAYADALKAEAKKAKKRVDLLGPTAKLRAEAAAWNALQAIGDAVTAVNKANRPSPTGPKIVESANQPLPKAEVKKTAKRDGPSKKEIAISTFNSFELGARRKVIIEAIMAAANLSKPGAATYYQNIKSGKWS